jgi:hypothetical protein
MLSKGQGRTMATYELLLQALDEEGRVEEADALFEKILTENEECTPRSLFHRVMTMHERYNQPKRLLEVLCYFLEASFLRLEYSNCHQDPVMEALSGASYHG